MSAPGEVHYIVGAFPSKYNWNGERFNMYNDPMCAARRWGNWGVIPSFLPPLYQGTTSSWDIPIPQDVESYLVPTSLNEMLPKVKEEANVAVDLLELRDVLTITKTVKRLRDFLTSFLKNKLSLKQLAATSSDVYLQWSFNIAPMMADIIAVRDALKNLNKQLRWLQSNSKKLLSAHRRYYLNDSYPNFYDSTAWDVSYVLDGFFC
jgi:hypothetical protein